MSSIYEYEVDAMVEQLCKKITRVYNFRPDALFVIMKGGLITAKKIEAILGVPMQFRFHYSKYDVNGIILHDQPKRRGIEGYLKKEEKILIVDDVIETGDTLRLAYQEAKKLLKNNDKNAEKRIMVVSLITKGNGNVDGVTCPIISAKTLKRGDWVKFYWEEDGGK